MWLIVHLLIITGLSVRVLLRPHRDPASRIAWVLFIMALPYVGALMYLMLGEVRPGGLAVRRQIEPVATAGGTIDEQGVPAKALPGFSIGHTISGFLPIGGNTGQLLPDSDAAIDAMVADINASSAHVHLLFYIWLADHNGCKVVDALLRAAARGVTCRVIVDDLGSRDFIRSPSWLALQEGGVHVTRAQAIGNVVARILKGRVDVRNHRKIVVIDHELTYCGSQNCADPAFAIKAKYAPWVDLMVRFKGPVARQNQTLFLTDWLVCTGEDHRILLETACAGTEGSVLAQVIGTGPENNYSATPTLFSTLMFNAQRELLVTTPYYVPDASMQAALCASARRGIPTRLVLPARNDSWVVAAASRSHYAELLEAGVQIYEYVGGLLHAKSLTVDGEMALIGSANMDRRSFDLNFENNILLCDVSLTQAIRQRQADYIAQSKPVSLAEVASWKMPRRLLNNVMAIFSPLL